MTRGPWAPPTLLAPPFKPRFAPPPRRLRAELPPRPRPIPAAPKIKEFRVVEPSPPRTFIRPRRVDLAREALSFYELATMLDAGLNLQKAVVALVNMRQGVRWTHVLAQLRTGSSFSQAVTFLPVTARTLLSVGEETGDLGRAVRRVATYMDLQVSMRRRLTSMMVYPIVVFALCMVGVIGLPPLLFRGLYQLLATLNVQVPLSTRVLMGVSQALESPWTWLLVFFVGLAAVHAYRVASQEIAFRRRRDGLLLRLRFVGDVWRHHLLALMVLNLEALYQAGIPIQRALRLAGQSTGNLVFEDMAERLADQTVAGQTLSDSMQTEPLLPALLSHLVRTGEESGKLTSMLGHFVRLTNGMVEEKIQKTLALLEPAMYWLIGSVTGFIAVASLSPLLTAMENLVR